MGICARGRYLDGSHSPSHRCDFSGPICWKKLPQPRGVVPQKTAAVHRGNKLEARVNSRRDAGQVSAHEMPSARPLRINLRKRSNQRMSQDGIRHRVKRPLILNRFINLIESAPARRPPVFVTWMVGLTATHAAARVHGDRRIATTNPQPDPADKSGTAAAVHQHHRRHLPAGLRLGQPDRTQTPASACPSRACPHRRSLDVIRAVPRGLEYSRHGRQRPQIPGWAAEVSSATEHRNAQHAVAMQSKRRRVTWEVRYVSGMAPFCSTRLIK